MDLIASMQRRQNPLLIWVITLALLASQLLASSHYHFFSHTDRATDAILHTIDSNNLAYVFLAQKIKDRQTPHNHTHDEDSCDLCHFASLSWHLSSVPFVQLAPQIHSVIANNSSVLAVHSLQKDALPRAPPPHCHDLTS